MALISAEVMSSSGGRRGAEAQDVTSRPIKGKTQGRKRSMRNDFSGNASSLKNKVWRIRRQATLGIKFLTIRVENRIRRLYMQSLEAEEGIVAYSTLEGPITEAHRDLELRAPGFIPDVKRVLDQLGDRAMVLGWSGSHPPAWSLNSIV